MTYYPNLKITNNHYLGPKGRKWGGFFRKLSQNLELKRS